MICIIWLPFNILFSSIYMGSIARWYLGLSERNINNISEPLNETEVANRSVFVARSLTTKHQFSKQGAVRFVGGGRIGNDISSCEDDVEETSISTSAEDDAIDVACNENPECSNTSNQVFIDNICSTLMTMEDIIKVVHNQNKDTHAWRNRLFTMTKGPRTRESRSSSLKFESLTPCLSIRQQPHQEESYLDQKTVVNANQQPCLGLRVLVQERMAQIIVYDICGGATPHHVDARDDYIVVKIGQWKDVVSKWSIPNNVWKSFRAAALESMMLVGERALITIGPKALFQLSPDEFQNMFNPVVASMVAPIGSSIHHKSSDKKNSILKGWLKETDELAQTSFFLPVDHDADEKGDDVITTIEEKHHRKLAVQDNHQVRMPKNQGTLFQY